MDWQQQGGGGGGAAAAAYPSTPARRRARATADDQMSEVNPLEEAREVEELLEGRTVEQYIADHLRDATRSVREAEEANGLTAQRRREVDGMIGEIADEVTLENHVFTGVMGREFNLNYALWQIPGSRVSQSRLTALVIPVIPKVTFLLYRNGNLVATGSKNVENLERGLVYLTNVMRGIGYVHALPRNLRVQNIVAKVMLKCKEVDISALAEHNNLDIHLQHTLFPGAVIRLPQNRNVTVILFGLGKMVVIGARSEDSIRNAVCNVYEIAKPFFARA